MSEIWGLRLEEARDRFYFDLNIGLPLPPVFRMIRACQTQKTDYREITLKAVNRRSKTINC
jgi:two-component system CheB/CheR fusion protein